MKDSWNERRCRYAVGRQMGARAGASAEGLTAGVTEWCDKTTRRARNAKSTARIPRIGNFLEINACHSTTALPCFANLPAPQHPSTSGDDHSSTVPQ